MKKLSLLLITLFAVFACKNEADPQADKSFFTKFYDNNAFNVAYVPLDAVQTTDGGYIVLGLKKAMDTEGDDIDPGTIYLMRIDEFGAIVSDSELDPGLGMPAASLLNVSGRYFFFCMDRSNYGIQLIEVDNNGSVAQQLNIGGSYPLAAGVDGTSMMLLSYDPGERTTVMSTVSVDGAVEKSEGFGIGAADGPYAPEDDILGHSLRTGPQLPFFVGKTATGYYFNGIVNYTLAIVFTGLDGSGPAGVINGSNVDGAVSALYSLPGGKFAASRYNFGDNYLLPSGALETNGNALATEIGGFAFPELIPDAPVKIIGTKINGTDRIIYGSNTRGKQIGLYGYNPADGSFAGSKYIGFSNSFELASIVPTADEGLLVLGTTYIAGRFPRICLFKLSAETLGKSFQ